MIFNIAVESTSPASLTKVILCLLILLVWARWATIVDKDAMFYHQKRQMWNLIHIGGAGLAFLILFLVPLFIVGMLLGLIILIAAGAAYVIVRNGSVPETERWKFNVAFFREIILAKRAEHAAEKATLKFTSPPAGLQPAPVDDDPQFKPHLMIEQILIDALQRHAQRIDLAGNDKRFVCQFRIDGVDYRQSEFPANTAMAATDYLKAQCGMDITDRRRKQTGNCSIEAEGHGVHSLRLRAAGSTRGLTYTILIDPVEQLTRKLEDLGLLENQLEQVKQLIEKSSGTVLVASPAGHGRTTTLYTLLDRHDPYTMDIHSIENTIERNLEGITQHEVDPAEQPKRLHSQLLRDPQIIMVASVTDQQSAQELTTAGKEGKRAYAGLRTDDGFTALKLWAKAVGDCKQVGDAVVAVIAQRLFRKLCTVCRQAYQPEEASLRKLNLPVDRIKQLYKASGKVMIKNQSQPCPACGGVGYMGRVAAFEVLVFDDQATQLMRQGKLDALRLHLRKNKTLWLEEAALSKVVAGQTSISEVMRVLDKK